MNVERASVDSQEGFRQLMEAAPDAMLAVDEQGKILLVNPLVENLFGYSRQEICGQLIEVLVPYRFRERHVHMRSDFCAKPHVRGMGSGRELTGLRKDGREFPAEISLAPIATETGLLIVAAIRDTTERHRVNQELANNLRIQTAVASILRLSLEPLSLEEFLQRTLDTLFSVPGLALQSKGAIFLMDGQLKMLEMKAHSSLPDSLIRQCGRLCVGQCLCGRAAALREVVFSDHVDECHTVSYPGMPPHGHYCVPILSSGELFGVVNLYVEEGHQRKPEEERFLTAVADSLAGAIRRRRAESAQQASEERFDLAVRGTDAGIWDWDLYTNQVYFSPRWKSMLGYANDELENHFSVWESRLHPEDARRAMATVHDYLSGKTKEYELEHRLRHKDGTYRWILARGAAVFGADGRPYRMVWSHLDITDRKRDAASLQEKETQMLAAQEIQRRLLPSGPPRLPGFDMAAATSPAGYAAGDLYDYLRLSHGRVGLVVGDVCGHGIGPALFMAAVHSRLRALAECHVEIEDILARANAHLVEESEPGMFVTVFLGCLDPQARTLSYASAGHPTGYVLDASGNVKAELKSTAPPVAIDAESLFPVVGPTHLQLGDLVLLLTDGVLETVAPTGDFFGIERTLQVVRSHRTRTAQEILGALHRAVSEFAHPDRLHDDVTAMIIKVTA
jgi:PAS domain S-box-containing protein